MGRPAGCTNSVRLPFPSGSDPRAAAKAVWAHDRRYFPASVARMGEAASRIRLEISAVVSMQRTALAKMAIRPAPSTESVGALPEARSPQEMVSLPVGTTIVCSKCCPSVARTKQNHEWPAELAIHDVPRVRLLLSQFYRRPSSAPPQEEMPSFPRRALRGRFCRHDPGPGSEHDPCGFRKSRRQNE